MNILSTTIKYMRQEKAWQNEHNPQAPKKGESAPDFELRGVDGISSFRLSDYRGKKPVALIFGSFS
jgi:peroxiredoxin